MKLTEFDVYRDLLKEKSGILIAQDQSYVLESRLGPIARKWGYPSMESMTLALQGVPDKQLVSDIIEAMISFETSFFMDTAAAQSFKDNILPALAKSRARQRKIRIWCAGTATGQEPYSIAMILKETESQRPGWKAEILATDISNDALEQARQGFYSQAEAQRGLSTPLLLKYFAQQDNKWKISSSLQKMITFQYFNLLDPMRELGTFDVIFCRNVLHNFDEETRRDVLERMNERLEDDGFLILGERDSPTMTLATGGVYP